MDNSYTRHAIDLLLDASESSASDIWRIIDDTPAETSAEGWKELFRKIALSFSCSPSYALLRILAERMKKIDPDHVIIRTDPDDADLVWITVTLPSMKGPVVFSEVPQGAFQPLSQEDTQRLKSVLLCLASRQKDYTQLRSEARELINNALQSSKDYRTALLPRPAVIELGHVLGLTLDEMQWLMLRVLEDQEAFDYLSSSDLIDIYGFVVGGSLLDVRGWKSEFQKRVRSRDGGKRADTADTEVVFDSARDDVSGGDEGAAAAVPACDQDTATTAGPNKDHEYAAAGLTHDQGGAAATGRAADHDITPAAGLGKDYDNTAAGGLPGNYDCVAAGGLPGNHDDAAAGGLPGNHGCVAADLTGQETPKKRTAARAQAFRLADLSEEKVLQREAAFTQQVRQDFVSLAKSWAVHPDDRDERMLAWLTDHERELDAPSRSASLLYRTLAVYCYMHPAWSGEDDNESFLHGHPDLVIRGLRTRAVEEPEELLSTLRRMNLTQENLWYTQMKKVLYPDGRLNQENCMRLAKAIYTMNMRELRYDSDNEKNYITLNVPSYGKAYPTGLRDPSHVSRIASLLLGIEPVGKRDAISLLYLIYNCSWQFYSIEDNEQRCDAVFAFEDGCRDMLRKMGLPDLYMPHPMEQAMFLSIVDCMPEENEPEDDRASASTTASAVSSRTDAALRDGVPATSYMQIMLALKQKRKRKGRG